VKLEADREKGELRHWALLLAIVAAGALLRMVAIGREALWADEALTLVLAHWPLGEMVLQPADQTPFLYYSIHKLLFGADASAAAVRTISLAAGVLAIPLVYAAGRLCFGRGAGLVAAALLAVWGPHIDYSQEARAYALFFLIVLASATSLLWWFDEAVRTNQRRLLAMPARRIALACFATATALSFYAHITSIFWIACALQILISLSVRTEARRYMGEVAAALCAMALLAAPGLIRLAREVALPDAFHWLRQASPADFVATTADVLLPLGAGPIGAALQAAAAVAIVVLLLRRKNALREMFGRNPAAAAVILALLALPLIVWLAGFAIRPIFMFRTALAGVPGAVLLIAGTLELVRGTRARAFLASGAVALLLAPSLLAGTVREKEEWRGAFAALAQRVRPGDLIVACPSWKYPALRHAAGRTLPAPVTVPFGEALLIEPALGSDPAWDRTFFDSVTGPVARDLNGGPERGPYPRSNVSLPPSARVWLVASECSEDEARSVAQWLGGAPRWTTVWRSPGTPEHAGIEISGYAPGRALDLPVRLAR
jgi:hypothetical protein